MSKQAMLITLEKFIIDRLSKGLNCEHAIQHYYQLKGG